MNSKSSLHFRLRACIASTSDRIGHFFPAFGWRLLFSQGLTTPVSAKILLLRLGLAPPSAKSFGFRV